MPPGRLAVAFLAPSASVPTGVGHDPDAVASVRGANGRSWNAVPLRVIPERGQIGENASESSSKESWDVLHDDVAGSKLANEARVFGPKTRACAVDPSSSTCEADVLAGEAAAEDIDGLRVSEFAHIGVAGDVGPVSGEDAAAELVGFALPGDAHPCSFEAKIEPSDS